jgi:hypothetical protein
MTNEQLAKNIGWTAKNGVVYNAAKKKVPTYRTILGSTFAFRHNNEIKTGSVDKFCKLFEEKAPNLLNSESKTKRDELIFNYYLKNRSYDKVLKKFDISRGCLFQIILRQKNKDQFN